MGLGGGFRRVLRLLCDVQPRRLSLLLVLCDCMDSSINISCVVGLGGGFHWVLRFPLPITMVSHDLAAIWQKKRQKRKFQKHLHMHRRIEGVTEFP